MTFEANFRRTWEIYRRGVDQGHHFGAQLFVSKRGHVLADEAFGIAELDTVPPEGEPKGRPARTDDLWLWLSACKPVGAVAVAQLEERGLVDIDVPVAQYIPEFGASGKDRITTCHILTHTAGFPHVELPAGLSQAEAMQRIADAPLAEDWVPGETAGYHPRSSWYVLAELVERLDGRTFSEYIREDIFAPLDMNDSWIGMTHEAYRQSKPRIVPSYLTEKGGCSLLELHTEPAVTAPLPGGNGRGPIRELGRFYEMLLNGGEGNGARILRPDTVAKYTKAHRIGKMDRTFQHRMDWGLGFIIDSKQHGKQTVPYGYGDRASPRTFGHGGHMSATGFADPEHGLVVAAAFNGLPGHPRHNKRIRDFCTAIYEDVHILDD